MIILFYLMFGFLYLKLIKFSHQDILGCGLAGYSGKNPVDPWKMGILLFFNQERGIHSTGIYSNKKVVKEATAADNFIFNNKKYPPALEGSKLVLGHTRHATMGEHTDENAHPFTSGIGRGTIYGTHNGWLIETVTEDLAEKYNLKMPAVDSKLIFDLMVATKGVEILKDIAGAVALAFVKNSKLHLYRRDARPLYFGYTAEHEFYYSSMKIPLKLIGCRDVKFMATDKVFILEEGNVVNTVDIGLPKYLPSMPAGCQMGQWKWFKEIPSSEISEIPIRSKKEEQAYNNSSSWMGKQKQLPMRGGDANIGGNSWKSSSGSISVIEKQANFLHTVTDKEELLATHSTNKQFAMSDEADSSCALIHFVNSQTGEPALGLPVFVAEYPEIATETNENGVAFLRIVHPEHESTTVRILVADPLTDRVFYSTRLEFRNKRVSEVTLSIPFRSKEEAKALNEREGQCDDLLRRIDIFAIVSFVPSGEQKANADELVVAALCSDGRANPDTNKVRGCTDDSNKSKLTPLMDDRVWQEEGYESYLDYEQSLARKWRQIDERADAWAKDHNAVNTEYMTGYDLEDMATLSLICTYKDETTEFKKDALLDASLAQQLESDIETVSLLIDKLTDAADTHIADKERRETAIMAHNFLNNKLYLMERALNEVTNNPEFIPF